LGTSTGKRRASTRAKAVTALTLALAICLLAPSFASATASYVFEPTLSLTGNCATSKLDPVPDPGLCPIPPGVPGKDHPSARLEAPSVTIDSYGDIYVANMLEAKGRIDVFAPDGTFITEFADPAGPQSIAVDAKGNVYLFERVSGGARQIRRFPPKVYEPEEGKIEYGEEPVVLANNETKPVIAMGPETSLAIEPSSQRLYVDTSLAVAMFGAVEEENELLEKETISGLLESSSLAIDAKHKKIYVSNKVPITSKSAIRIFELEGTHKELGKITGSTAPQGEFLSGEGVLELDVDEETGHVFVGDIAAANKVYEFEESGAYLATIEHGFEVAVGPGGVPGEIAVDNGPKSPHRSWLFVPSVPSPSPGHGYAFEPNEEGPPIVESTSVDGITETEATLHATINPDGLATTYRLEYVSQKQFEASGFAEATLAGEGTLPKGAEGVAVSAPATELQPGTKYRFRVFARNENAKEEEGKDEKEGTFETFPAEVQPPACENETFRIGLSALLPDCRAYELVTPGDTNGRPPSGVGFTGVYFQTLEASPDGNRASFLIEGGLIPGNEGAGAFNGDLYLATRGAEGWTSEVTGPSGKEVVGPNPGSVSPDQTYSFWKNAHTEAIYIRYPDGHSELVGRGSLGEDPLVQAKLITENGGHIIFVTEAGHAIPLEPNAPPTKTAAVYDRSAEGPTHVVSLLPGDISPGAGEDAAFRGASEDGEGIAFEIGKTLYVRLNSAETLEVASGVTFAGISKEGKRVFYLQGGNLFAFDTETEAKIPFSTSGDITLVNVAEDGTRAYFVSSSVLTGEPNPNGEVAKAGKEGEQNLYFSEEGQISFVGRVTKRDVEGEKRPILGQISGLGLWLDGFQFRAPDIDPSRATPSGLILLFESRANLTGFDSNGFAQVYRYDSAQNRLDCLSCSPTGTPPTHDASLQSFAEGQPSLIPASHHAKIPNQSPDGARAIFQTAEPLVVGDTDELLDVYEWEEEGVGSCETKGGCVYLISGAHSSSPDFLFAMSSSGNDVFFRTTDLLLPRDKETTLSIYDARVEGGFPEPEPKSECEGEGCHPPNPAPSLREGTTSAVGPNGNPEEPKHCPKGKHKHHGKCVKNHKKHHRGTGAKKKGVSR
jgi:hypothetical protein